MVSYEEIESTLSDLHDEVSEIQEKLHFLLKKITEIKIKFDKRQLEELKNRDDGIER